MRKFRPPQVNMIDPAPEGYVSYQQVINSHNGEINQMELDRHIEEILDKGWYEIKPEQVKTNHQVRYTVKKDGKRMFRTGGFVRKVDLEDRYFAYWAHTNSSWVVQFEDIEQIWVKNRGKKKKFF